MRATSVSRVPLPPPPFVDSNRSLIATHPRDYWRQLLDSDVFRDQGGYYVITRREDVRAALRDHAIFGSRRKLLAPSSTRTKTLPIPVPIGYDPPEHSRFRRILRPYFNPQTVDAISSRLREQALVLIDAVTANGACEAITEIANPYPFRALATLCGLPLDDAEKLEAWVEAISWDMPGSRPEVELVEYLVDAITGDPPPALAAQLLTGDDPLTEDEVIAFYSFLCFAQDGMQAAIGSALLHLARDSKLCAALRDNPDKIRVFAEKVIRLETPLPFIGRYTTQQVTIDGVTIPAGSVVRLCLASANLDGSEETSMNVDDDEGILPKPHRSFGGGVHRCLGKALARMELNVMVAEWLRAVPEFELEPGYAQDITFTQGGGMMPRSLPLRWRQPEMARARPASVVEIS